jgi:hypothetical protein
MEFELLAGMMLVTAAAHFLCGWVFWKRSALDISYFGFLDAASPNRWRSTTPPALLPLFENRTVTAARNTIRAVMLTMFGAALVAVTA